MINEGEVGKRIKACRLKKKITLARLAEKAGLTKGYLSKIENTRKAPPVSTLIILARVLGINVSDILGEKKAPHFNPPPQGKTKHHLPT